MPFTLQQVPSSRPTSAHISAPCSLTTGLVTSTTATELTNELIAKLSTMQENNLKQVICNLRSCLSKADATDKAASKKENFVNKCSSPHARLVNTHIHFVSAKKRRSVKVLVSKPIHQQSLTIKDSLEKGDINAWFSEREMTITHLK